MAIVLQRHFPVKLRLSRTVVEKLCQFVFAHLVVPQVCLRLFISEDLLVLFVDRSSIILNGWSEDESPEFASRISAYSLRGSW
jgi:hypothetical protein